MTDKQADALKLAKKLDTYADGTVLAAADELRRLNARVVELEKCRRAIIAEKDDYKLALRHAIAELEAIGAGGVESLRKKGNA